MAAVTATLNVLVNTQQAQKQLAALSAQVTAVNAQMMKANTGASAASLKNWNNQLVNSVNATGQFNARIVPVTDSMTRFTQAIETNKLSLGQYTRHAASVLPGMSRVFRKEFDMMTRTAEDRVKRMQTQFTRLGNASRGVSEAMAATPTGLAGGMSKDLAVAAQRQMIFNKLIKDGTTKMLNWGKNTQWAGRQLMVGFSLPLAALGTVAAKTFMELDKASVALRRVYGDLGTSTGELERNVQAMKDLGAEYTKYGIAVKDTIDLAARVAATGAEGADLAAATEQTLRFATLGQMEYNAALDATISLQTAFKISSEDLAGTVDYLNAVENQTILKMEDMAAAIPRVAPVIKGLGGDVKDLTAMMVAMREGGITAEQGANALKSGLASLINPTKRAQETLQKLGIDLNGIIETNRGDLLGTVQAFGQALSALDDFTQQQALEQIFGKYQYARMGALFKNIAGDATQAARAIELSSMSVGDLAQLADKELGKLSESTTVKFQASMEQLKLSIAPLGEQFLKVITPLAGGITKLLDSFNNLPDAVKNIAAAIVFGIAGIGPVILMTIGLIANGFANMGKLIQGFRAGMAKLRGDASSFTYLAESELEARAASQQLEASANTLTGSLLLQQRAVGALTAAYQRYGAVAAGTGVQLRGAAQFAPIPVRKMATGGTVLGTGNKDTVPAMLTPGETVLTKAASNTYGDVINAMNAGTLKMYGGGLDAINAEGGGRPYGHVVRGHGVPSQPMTPDQLAVVQELEALKAQPNTRTMNATSGHTLTNWTWGIPQVANDKMMTPSQAGGMFSSTDPSIRGRLQAPLAHAIAEQMDMLPEQLVADPTLKKALDNLTGDIGSELGKVTGTALGEQMSDADFYKANDKAIKKLLADPNVPQNMKDAVVRTRNQPTAMKVRTVDPNTGKIVNNRTALSPEAQMALGASRAMTPYKSLKMYGPKGDSFPASAAPGWVPPIISNARQGNNVPPAPAAPAPTAAEQSMSARRAAALAKQQAAAGGSRGGGFVAGSGGTVPATRSGEGFRIDSRGNVMRTPLAIESSTSNSYIKRLREGIGYRKAVRTIDMNEGGFTAGSPSRVSQAFTKTIDKFNQATNGLGQRITDYSKATTQKIGDYGRLASEGGIRGVLEARRLSQQQPGAKPSLLSRFGGKMGRPAPGLGMGLGMASMLPMMMQNDQGQFLGMDAGAASMGLMGASMLTMLPGPLMAVGAAAGVTAVAIKLLKDNIEKSAKAAAEAGANIGGTANALNTIAEVFQQKTPTQRAAQMQLNFSPEEQQKAFGEFQQYLDSDVGTKFLDGLKDLTSAERFTKLSDYIRSGIAAGIMDQSTGELFAKTVAVSLNDSMLGTTVVSNLRSGGGVVQGSGTLLDMARSRQDAVNANPQEEQNSLIGSSIQIMQDYGNAAALANEELRQGKISFQEYSSIAAEAKSAQQRYTKSLMDVVKGSDASAAAYNDQMSKILTEDQMNAMKDATEQGGFFLNSPKVGNVTASNFEGYAKSEIAAAVAGGMSADLAISTMQYIRDNADSEMAKIWANNVGSGQALAVAGFSQTALDTATQLGLDQEGGKAYMEVGLKFALTNAGTLAEFQALINAIPEEKRMDFLITMKGLTAQQLSAMATTQQTTSLNGQDLLTYVTSQPYKQAANATLAPTAEQNRLARRTGDVAVGSTDTGPLRDLESARQKVENQFKDKSRKVIIETMWQENGRASTPEEMTAGMNEVADTAIYIEQRVPTDIRVSMGIDTTDPQQMSDLKDQVQEIGVASEILKNLPDDVRPLAAGISVSVKDGKNKVLSGAQLLEESMAIQKALKNIDSTKPKVERQAALTLMMTVENEKGERVDITQVGNYYDRWIKEFGQKKVSALSVNELKTVTIIEGQIIGAEAAVERDARLLFFATEHGITGAALDDLREKHAASVAVAQGLKAAKTTIFSMAGSGGSTPSSSGGGGGGGGEKKNPYKDFKSMIVKQIQQFADAGASLKTLLKAKYGFFKILNMQDGIDDKIRKAGLPSGISEYLMGLDVKEAKKVLGKITRGNGRLNSEGRKLQDRYMAGQISERTTTARNDLTNSGYQRAALASLGSRPRVGAQAYSVIAGDPAEAEKYMYLVDKVKEKEDAFNKAKKGHRAAERKARDAARKDLSQYIAAIVNATRATEAMEKATEMAFNHAQTAATYSLTNMARTNGATQDTVDAIGSGDYTSLYQKRKRDLANAKTANKKKNNKKTREDLRVAQAAVDNFFADVQQQITDTEKLAWATNPFQYIGEQSQKQMDAVQAQFDAMAFDLEEQSDIKFNVDYGVSKEGANQIIKKNDVLINQAQSQINAYQRSNDVEQRAIDLHEREKRQWQDKIDLIQDVIDGYQRQIDLLQHASDLRNHEADLINHELDIMSRQEDAINKAFDERVAALEKTQQLNQHIIDQQKQQIGLAQALTSGDIYAAAAAAQEMTASSAAYSAEQTRAGLDTGRQNAINGLVGGNGMTRVQMEDQLFGIQQQNYQTELLVWDLEQKIYAQNEQMIPLKDEIEKIDDLIREHTDKIFANNGEILRIQQETLEPLKAANDMWNDRLTTSKSQLDYDIGSLKYQGKSLEAWDTANKKLQVHMNALKGARELATGLFNTWLNIGQAIAEANTVANRDLEFAQRGQYQNITSVDPSSYFDKNGDFDYKTFEQDIEKIKQDAVNGQLAVGDAAMQAKSTGGSILGDGSRDSVPARLTPGEFVIRKAMVDKYGIPMLTKLNQGAFKMPTYSMPSANSMPQQSGMVSSSSQSSVYNNSYSINVSATSNASADDIANTVMSRMKQVNSMNVRGNRGY